MKRILLITVLIAAMFSITAFVTCIAMPLAGKNIKGSGNIVTRTLPAPDFDAIDASRAVKVVISDQASDIRIDADDNLMDLVVVQAVNGRLEVTLDKQVNNVRNADITVTVPANGNIRSLYASTASQIRSDAALKADTFSIGTSSGARIDATVEAASCGIKASSGSRIHAAVKAVNCSAEASSGSKIELSGSADTFNARLSSGSKLAASNFTAVNAAIDTSSGSGAVVDCSGKLTASASSGSSIRYTGDCQISLSKSSGGSVQRN